MYKRQTYLCLQSILEHTKDVSYEVIIADDVSTDATEHLAEFADNLVICRNQTNPVSYTHLFMPKLYRKTVFATFDTYTEALLDLSLIHI